MVFAPMCCHASNMTIALASPTDATATTSTSGTRSRTAINWRMMVRPALALIIIVAAYRVSLLTLLEAMRLDTPLAHLSLVPFIALGLAAMSRNRDSGPAIHDRQLDWIVGLFLCLVALAANVILPARLSTQFWIWRLDLLTLPLFVAGVVTLLFGVRTLWKFRYAVGFLALAWPYPYTLLLDRYLAKLTSMTITSLDAALEMIPLATKVAGSDSSFQVLKNGHDVTMSVASACSGANGMLGFSIVAAAFMLVLDGSKKRKIGWLAAGALLVWILNVVRIMVIFWAAGQWGERVAIDGFHPYVGLVVFNIAIVFMVIMLKPFGLRIRRSAKPTANPLDPHSPSPAPHRPRIGFAMCCVALSSLGVGLFNGQLRDYDRIADSLGSPRLASFQTSQETPDGWSLTQTNTYPEYRRFFGDDSQWIRYRYLSTGTTTDGSTPTFISNVPITVDVIDTSDRAALDAYGIEQCYTFHGFAISANQSVDLGEGLFGGMLTWTQTGTANTYTTLYWHWPIKTASGTRYERVTLVMNDQATNTFTSPPLTTDGARELQSNLNDVLQGKGSPEDRERLIATRQFMVGFARELVSMRSPASDA